MDQKSSTAGRVWGPVTGWLARVIGVLGRGHRGGSHDVLLGTLGFALAFAAASINLYTSVVAVGLVIALAIHALDHVIPGKQRLDPIPSALLSLTWAWMLVGHAEYTWWLPFAAAVGVVTHIGGDALTTEGVPVPFSWITRRRTVGLRLFNAGARPEKWITRVCIVVAVGGTLWWTSGQSLLNVTGW